MELSVSILNAKDKINMIKKINTTDISYIHLDVMDGKFVSQKTLSPEEISYLANVSDKKLDIHLMVEEPLDYIEKIKELSNVEYITIHLEINKDVKNILKKIKSYGYKCGLSIKPNTDINKLIPYLDDIDLILLMSVEPGLGGQNFIPESKLKLSELKKITKENIKIEVDGGINNLTIKEIERADIAVVGSYITTSENPIEKINILLNKK